MDPLVLYYLNQAGRGQGSDGIGPVYALPPFYQRGHGIGSFLGGLWRMVRPILWKGAKTVGRETLRTGGQILTDIADNNDAGDVVKRRARELVGKLRGRGLVVKRKAPKQTKRGGKKPKRAGPTKRDIFSD